MNVQNNGKTLSCVGCGSLNCKKRSGKYPGFYLTQDVTRKRAAELEKLHMDDNESHRVAIADTQVESEYSRVYTRVGEIMESAKQIGVRRIETAICSGLIAISHAHLRVHET